MYSINLPWIDCNKLMSIWFVRDDIVHRAWKLRIKHSMEPNRRSFINKLYELDDLERTCFLTRDGAERYLRKIKDRNEGLAEHLEITEVLPE